MSHKVSEAKEKRCDLGEDLKSDKAEACLMLVLWQKVPSFWSRKSKSVIPFFRNEENSLGRRKGQ